MRNYSQLCVLTLGCVVSLFVPVSAPAQTYDTVRVMTYNLLNYPGNSSAARNPEFRKVLRFVNPDILVVQEMISAAGTTEFLNEVMNYGQPGAYNNSPFSNGPDTDNAMYYKSSRFSFVDDTVLHTALRDINGYQLRPAGIGADSLDLRIYSAHLKASLGFEQDRLDEADTLRNHLNALPDGLFLIAAGDLNLYTSSEPAFQELIGSQSDNSGRLYDPKSTPGDWHDDGLFAAVHTQSSRFENLGDGGATGGLDDRFDFLLPSFAFQSGTRWHYVTGTYTEVGNDGNHFNQSINAGTNGAVPDSIADAMYVVSDHLPVYFDLYRQNLPPASIILIAPNGGEIWYIGNPYSISWTSQNVTGNVRIELNRAYPSGAWEILYGSAVNDGTEPWTVTEPATAQARLRIFSITNPSVGDSSAANFEIEIPFSPPVIVHDPHGDGIEGLITFIADVTDNMPNPTIKLFYRAWDAFSSDSVTMVPTGFGNERAASLAFSFGRHVYFIRAVDSDFQFSSTDTFEFVVAPECGLAIGYDDGSAESFHWSEQDGFKWAVKFTPPVIPFVLCSADIGIAGFHPDSSHNQITVLALAADGPGGLPGTVLREVTRGSIGNEIGGLPADSEYSTYVVMYDDSVSPLVFSGDFYVAVKNVFGGTEAFALDTSSVLANRSYVWDPCEEAWMLESDLHPNTRRGNRMIVVRGWQNSPGQLVIRRSGNDIQLNWSETGAPYYRIYQSLTADGSFADLIGSTSDSAFVVQGVVPLETRAFYRIHSSSSP